MKCDACKTDGLNQWGTFFHCTKCGYDVCYQCPEPESVSPGQGAPATGIEDKYTINLSKFKHISGEGNSKQNKELKAELVDECLKKFNVTITFPSDH